jgi:hypothetical protein
MASVRDQRWQLARNARDLLDISENSEDFGKSRVLHDLFLIIETLLLGGAIVDAVLTGGILTIILVLGGLLMVALHVGLKRFEHRRYNRHKTRVSELNQELQLKVQELEKEAESLDKPPRWWWPFSWW